MITPASLAADPFPDLTGHDLTIAYAALVGTLSAKVPAEVYAEAVFTAREFVAKRKADKASELAAQVEGVGAVAS